ncbi:type III secretion system protein PrgJ, partial [Citrobacter freundii]
ALNNPDVTSDPEQLAIWQNKLSAYTIDTSLYSTLARKGVSAIETLIKT